MIVVEVVGLDQLPEPLAGLGIDGLPHPGPHSRVVAVPDGLHEQVLERAPVGERLAEDVEHLAAEGRAHLVELAQQRGVDVALTGAGGHQVPQLAHLRLPDAVDAAEPLLDAVGVPGEVVIDHEVGRLKVQTLARGVGGDEELRALVVGELGRHPAALLPPDAAVDREDGLRRREHTDPPAQVLEGVAVLGEHDELLRPPRVREHLVLDHGAELGPLDVAARRAEPPRQLGQLVERRQLGVELGDRPGAGGRVDHLLDGVLELRGREVLLVVEGGRIERGLVDGHPVGQVVAPRAEPGRPADQRLVDGLRARREPPLEHGEGEADGVLALAVELISPVHLGADVAGDPLVEVLLVVGELVAHRGGHPLREERLALERAEVLLHHAAHEGARVGPDHPVAGLAGEGVAVEEGHEELEVLLLARVRGRGHEEEVAGAVTEQLPQLEPPGLLRLVTEVVGAHPVRLVDNDEVPAAVAGEVEQGLVAGEVVHADDEPRLLLEDRAAEGGADELVGEDGEVEAELEVQLVLPLLDEPAGRDDEAAAHVVSQDQLLDVEAGHDRLARARIVGEQEAERHPGQHLLVDGLELVRERPDVAGGDRQEGVVLGRLEDAHGLRGQAELRAVGVERAAVLRDDGEPAGLRLEHHLPAVLAGLRAVGDLHCGGADRDHAEDVYPLVRCDAR